MELQAQRVKQLNCGKCGQELDPTTVKPLTKIRCPKCQATTVVPARFGDFLLVGGLGRGSMGVVCKALDEKLLRQVAIKILKNTESDKGLVEACLREARALASLNHNHVVQVYSIGEFHGQNYIVMELLDGGSVEKLMGAEPLDEAVTLDIAIATAEGLNAAHRVGLIHLDVKPGNILFDRTQTPKLVDFGIAQHNHANPDKLVGTPLYVAPEVVRGKKPDLRADIYSLGATVFHMLAARPPFIGQSPTKVMTARLKQPPPFLTEVRSDLHEQTAVVVDGMLAADPEQRYSTYEELIEALKIAREAADEPTAEDMLSQLAEASNPRRRPRR